MRSPIQILYLILVTDAALGDFVCGALVGGNGRTVRCAAAPFWRPPPLLPSPASHPPSSRNSAWRERFAPGLGKARALQVGCPEDLAPSIALGLDQASRAAFPFGDRNWQGPVQVLSGTCLRCFVVGCAIVTGGWLV